MTQRTNRTEKLDLRLSRAAKQTLQAAATAAHKSVSEFVLETALKRGVPTIPVLVGGAQIPRADELPESLKDLPFFNAAEVSAGLDFNQHIDRLIRAMEMILKGKAGLATAAPVRRTYQAGASLQSDVGSREAGLAVRGL